MAYNIYVEDTVTGAVIELDSLEDLDFSTVFAIADVKDLLTRRDVITKNLSFKFSKVNNAAFGFAMKASKYINEDDNTPILGGNYNPQISVPCSIYESGLLIIKGNLRLKTVTQNKYKCVLTGNVVEYTSKIADSLLTDLDLSDLTHTYNLTNIQNSWNGSKDYVYPVIQYGVPFKNPNALVSTTNPYNILNFKPAIFVKSIFNRIFSGIDYKYEMKGDTQFMDVFNKLIIPDNTLSKSSFAQISANITTAGAENNYDDMIRNGDLGVLAVQMGGITQSPNLFNFAPPFTFLSNGNGKLPNIVFNALQSFTSTAIIGFNINFKNNNTAYLQMALQLVSRPAINANSNPNEYNRFDYWDVVSELIYVFPSSTTSSYTNNNIVIPATKYEVGKQYMLRLIISNNGGTASLTKADFDYNFSLFLQFPQLAGQTAEMENTINSSITPTLPTGVKQLDFINSICSLFNLYKYTDPDDETKIIFQTYDSYYSKASEANLVSSAKDWTEYIDYSGDYSNDSNLDIVKNYNFKWKTDKDYLNDFYQNKHNKTYGDLQITDSRGILDKKEIQLIFSPTISAGSYSANNTPYFGFVAPYIYSLSGGNMEPLVSNIRLLIYNGQISSGTYNIVNEYFNTETASWDSNKFPTSVIPTASNYLIDSFGNKVYDLHFGQPEELFFPVPSNFNNIQYSYKYYNNQINELKSGNVTFLTCQAYLPANEISNLDLRTPVFIDQGRNGYSYHKVLSVDYTNSLSRSTVKFQKII